MAVDLNADLGESFGRWRLGDDEGMLAAVTSANVACGFHGGDPLTMLAVLERCAELGTAVGAHVAYRDLVGFGRRDLGVSAEELRGDVLYQLAALAGLARTAGTRVTYVKPHGALYNRIQRDPGQAAAVVAAVRDFDPALALLGMPGSVVLRLAVDAGLRGFSEGFADRATAADGSLLPRDRSGAVLTDPDEVAAAAVRLAAAGVDSICVHSDTAGAVTLATAVRGALARTGVAVAAFAPP